MSDKFQLKAILSAVDKITPTFSRIGKSAKILHKSLRDIGNAGSELMRKVGVPAFLSFSAISYGAIRATKSAMEYASAIQDASDRTGEGVENYQALANELGMVGGTAEDAEVSLSKFNEGIAKGAKNKEFFTLLKKLKVPLKDAKGHFSSLTDVLPQLAAGFAKNKDNPAIMTRMAKALFGKGGTKMIPVLLGIADGTLALADAQKKMGSIVNKDSVTALDDLGDSLSAVETQTKATLTNAIAQLVPNLQPIIKSLSDWIAKNQELIKTTIVTTVQEVIRALKDFDWRGMASDIKSIVSQIHDLVKAIGGIKVLIYGLGLAWAAGPIAAIFTIIGAVARLSLAFTALIPVANTAGIATAASFGASTATGIVSALGALATSGALLIAAGAVGYAIGTAISNYLLTDNFKDRLGRGIARTLSFFGNKEATDALIAEGQMEDPSKRTLTRYGYVPNSAVANQYVNSLKKQSNTETNSSITNNSVANQYVNSLEKKSNTETNSSITNNFVVNHYPSGALVKNQNSLNGQLNVRFDNAPIGMRVDAGKTNKSGVVINADVGYRKLAMN